ISTMFADRPLLDRIAAAARCGFRGIECQAPYAVPADAFAAQLEAHALEAVLINVPAGEGAADRGFAALEGQEEGFAASLECALAYARTIGCQRIHVLAGCVAADAASEAAFVANLRRAAAQARKDGVTLLIEPLNAGDNPGYFLRTTSQAAALLDRIGSDNVRLQFDFYHCQITEGDLAGHAERLFGCYAHVQMAGVPGRHEPDRGEIHYPYLLHLLDRLGYDGWVGCEYRPVAGTLDGLGWAAPWGIRARP
ncbi:MAG: hydroxypyruvate isomerase family protein, partial [Stellaceae bacterium]